MMMQIALSPKSASQQMLTDCRLIVFLAFDCGSDSYGVWHGNWDIGG